MCNADRHAGGLAHHAERGPSRLLVEGGQAPQKVRARVMYAGKAAGKKLQVAISGDQVLFALEEKRRGPGRPRKDPS